MVSEDKLIRILGDRVKFLYRVIWGRLAQKRGKFSQVSVRIRAKSKVSSETLAGGVYKPVR